MLAELTLATVMVTLTVLVHGSGLVLLARLLRLEERSDTSGHMHPSSPLHMAITLFSILALIGLHGVEIWLYAALYLVIGAIGDLREAVYFSTITYGAIGYSDTAMAPEWRLVSAIEGINGIIMIGWSTAFLIRIVSLLRRV
ncbi:ion channel [Novosphingobium tardum]|uniref:Ion channel n=1 Tax=Novosphingobium tardum TaxID=1538021 RepID=A0ABV8RRI7_9SPHN